MPGVDFDLNEYSIEDVVQRLLNCAHCVNGYEQPHGTAASREIGFAVESLATRFERDPSSIADHPVAGPVIDILAGLSGEEVQNSQTVANALKALVRRELTAPRANPFRKVNTNAL